MQLFAREKFNNTIFLRRVFRFSWAVGFCVALARLKNETLQNGCLKVIIKKVSGLKIEKYRTLLEYFFTYIFFLLEF
jgi:hypothetical protein